MHCPLAVIARSASDETIQSCLKPWIASLALAMTRESRRDAVSGDDLVGLPSVHFRHAIELTGEASGPRRSRTQFDDEIADFRFRHGRTNAIPSDPALARVEAKDLTAPP